MSVRPSDRAPLRENLLRLGDRLGVPVSPERAEQLEHFLGELSRWKAATNLVGDLSQDDLTFHCLESALGARWIEARESVLDIGSGAGFPGIPLAIWGVRITLLEPRQRRAAFLRHALRGMPGPALNATVRADRVEHLSRPAFDSATARAVGNLGNWTGKAKFLKSQGKLLVWAGDAGKLDMERGFRLEESHPIPESRNRRILVFRRCSTGNIPGDAGGTA